MLDDNQHQLFHKEIVYLKSIYFSSQRQTRLHQSIHKGRKEREDFLHINTTQYGQMAIISVVKIIQGISGYQPISCARNAISRSAKESSVL